MKRVWLVALLLAVGAPGFLAGAALAGAWPKRMANLQNTGNVGDDPALRLDSARDLKVVATIPTVGTVNATPVVSDGLLFVGDGGSGRYVYVIDLTQGNARLVQFDTGATVSTPLIGSGVQSTALLATVTVPDGTGGTNEQRRAYFGANVKPKSFWCLNVDAILAQRQSLAAAGTPSDGRGFLCQGADWPIVIAGLGSLEDPTGSASPLPVYDASPTFSKRQLIRDAAGNLGYHDVIFTPTIGADCSDGQLWAIDAYTAEVFWVYDPVPNFQNLSGVPGPVGPGYGGMIWTVPALSKDGKHLYVTTGDCVEQPQIGFQAESLVAIDPVDGTVQWWHQRRLVDTSDYDIGNSPVVVDVDDPSGCHNVVTSDKDGCIYGFRQEPDVPQVGDLAFDPTRLGQQRLLWRSCFVVGSLNGGFNANAVTFNDRTVFAQASGTGGRAPGDDVNAFAVDACDGRYRWSTSSIDSGLSEGAIASGMWFQPSGNNLQVMTAGPVRQLLATVPLPDKVTPGGGGPSIVDGTVYVPVKSGVAVVRIVPGSNASPAQPSGTETFHGPYPIPLGTGVEQVVLPVDPYDPQSPPAPPVAAWPSMHP